VTAGTATTDFNYAGDNDDDEAELEDGFFVLDEEEDEPEEEEVEEEDEEASAERLHRLVDREEDGHYDEVGPNMHEGRKHARMQDVQVV
jgi:hypothetical protein